MVYELLVVVEWGDVYISMEDSRKRWRSAQISTSENEIKVITIPQGNDLEM